MTYDYIDSIVKYDCSVKFIAEDRNLSYDKIYPKLINADIVNSGDLSHLLKEFSETAISVQGMRAYLLSDVYVLKNGIVVLKNGTIISDSIAHSRPWSLEMVKDHTAELSDEYLKNELFNNKNIVRHNSVFLLNQWSSGNFGHFLLEVGPKPVFVAGFRNIRDFTFLVSEKITGQIETVYKHYFSRCNFQNKIVRQNGAIHADNLIFVTTSGVHGRSKSPQNVKYSRNVLMHNGLKGESLVWLDRKSSRKRSPSNREELINAAMSRGFIYFDAEEESIDAQINMILSAKAVVGPIGAAFSSIIFANPSTKFLTLCPNELRETFFYECANIVRCNYAYLFGSAQDPLKRYNSDYYIEESDLSVGLDWVMSI